MQTSMPFIGPVSRPKRKHELAEIRICQSLSDAVYVSMRYASMSQETLSGRIHVSPSYMSLLMSGKRPWQSAHLQRIREVTGSLATLQYAAMREGVEIYADPIEQRKAELLAELESLKAA